MESKTTYTRQEALSSGLEARLEVHVTTYRNRKRSLLRNRCGQGGCGLSSKKRIARSLDLVNAVKVEPPPQRKVP